MKNKWRDAILRQLDVYGIYYSAHDHDPELAIKDIINWNIEVYIWEQKQQTLPKKIARFFRSLFTSKNPPF